MLLSTNLSIKHFNSTVDDLFGHLAHCMRWGFIFTILIDNVMFCIFLRLYILGTNLHDQSCRAIECDVWFAQIFIQLCYMFQFVNNFIPVTYILFHFRVSINTCIFKTLFQFYLTPQQTHIRSTLVIPTTFYQYHLPCTV